MSHTIILRQGSKLREPPLRRKPKAPPHRSADCRTRSLSAFTHGAGLASAANGGRANVFVRGSQRTGGSRNIA